MAKSYGRELEAYVCALRGVRPQSSTSIHTAAMVLCDKSHVICPCKSRQVARHTCRHTVSSVRGTIKDLRSLCRSEQNAEPNARLIYEADNRDTTARQRALVNMHDISRTLGSELSP